MTSFCMQPFSLYHFLRRTPRNAHHAHCLFCSKPPLRGKSAAHFTACKLTYASLCRFFRATHLCKLVSPFSAPLIRAIIFGHDFLGTASAKPPFHA